MQYDENLQARCVPSRQTGFNQCFLNDDTIKYDKVC